MKTRNLLIPRKHVLTEENTEYLDGTGRGFVVAHDCPQFESLSQFMASQWYADSTPMGSYYTCIHCEFTDQPCVYFDHEHPPTVHCEEKQEFGGPKTATWIGRLCPRCATAQRIKNRHPGAYTERAPQPKEQTV